MDGYLVRKTRWLLENEGKVQAMGVGWLLYGKNGIGSGGEGFVGANRGELFRVATSKSSFQFSVCSVVLVGGGWYQASRVKTCLPSCCSP